MTEQERREAVAAVAVHERQVEAAQAKVDGAADKIDKFKTHLKTLENDLRAAKKELAEEEAELGKVRKRAEGVLTDGPVTLGGHEVQAFAGVAQVDVAGKGGDN